MGGGTAPQGNNSNPHPKGLPPLPPRRSSRATKRVNYAAIDDGIEEEGQQQQQRQAGGRAGRQRAVAAACDHDAEYDAASDSCEDESGPADEDELLDEHLEAVSAAEGLVELADAADAAVQQDNQRPRRRNKQEFADGRFTEQEARDAYAAAPLSHVQSTNKNYSQVQALFEWWCRYEPQVNSTNKHKKGGFNATCKRRQQPYRGDLNGSDAEQLAARFLHWHIIDGMEGYQGQPKKNYKSDSTFKRVHAALQQMYRKKALAHAAKLPGSSDPGHAQQLQQDPLYKRTYKECKALYRVQPNQPLPSGVDPQDNSEQATFTLDELVKIQHHLLASDDPKDARDSSMLLWMSLTCGRGDDARPRRLCELTEPKLRSSIGPSKCWVVGLVQLMGKTLGDGFAAKGALRHKEPLLCAQGALGRWLITRFTLQEEAFPGPTSPEWKETMLWPAREPTKPMTYQNHKARLAALYAKLEIFIEKVTHACRIFAARYAEEAGLSDVEIARLGFWALTEMQLCYLLTGLKAAILLAMGGWDKDQPGMYWHERFMCPVPACLVDLLMPWYNSLEAAIEKADADGQHVHFSARGLLRLLPLLAYVVVQDALELCADGRPTDYEQNPVHQLLLSNETFRSMLREYGAAKNMGVFNASKPLTLSDKLDCVLHAVAGLQQQQSMLSKTGPAGVQLPSPGTAAAMEAVLKQLDPSAQAAIKPLLLPEAAAWVQQFLQPRTAADVAGVSRQQQRDPVPVMVATTEADEVAQVQGELQEQQQQHTGVGAAAAAAVDEDDPIISMEVEQPASPSPQDGNTTDPAAAAPAVQEPAQSSPGAAGAGRHTGALSPTTVMFTPNGGFRQLSGISTRPVYTPGGCHANPWWHTGCNNNLPQQQQDRLQAQPWRQPNFSSEAAVRQQQEQQQDRLERMVPLADLHSSVAGQDTLGIRDQGQPGGGAAPQQQQQQQTYQHQQELEAENQLLRQRLLQMQQQQQQQLQLLLEQQLQQPTLLSGAGTSTAVVDPLQHLMQPTITSVPGLSLGLPQAGLAGSGAGVLAAIKFAAHEAAAAALRQAGNSSAGDGAAAGAEGAAAGADGAATAMAAAAGGPPVPGSKKNRAAAGPIKPWGQQSNFTALWQWYNEAPAGFTASRAELEQSGDHGWRQGARKQLVSEMRQLLAVVNNKVAELGEQLGAGLTATVEQALTALDLQMQNDGVSNLAAYHKRYIKSPNASASKNTAAAGAAAGAGIADGAAAAAAGVAAGGDGEQDDVVLEEDEMPSSKTGSTAKGKRPRSRDSKGGQGSKKQKRR